MCEVSSKQTPKIWDTFTSANFFFSFLLKISHFSILETPFYFFKLLKRHFIFSLSKGYHFSIPAGYFWLTPSECTYYYSNNYNPGIQPHQ
jgi:hypothetical protein